MEEFENHAVTCGTYFTKCEGEADAEERKDKVGARELQEHLGRNPEWYGAGGRRLKATVEVLVAEE